MKFKTNRPPQNPLNPVYKLQHVEVIPPEPLRFIRDQMNVDDIDGSKPRVEKILASRDHFNVNDIEGARPKKHLVRGELHDQFFNDVTAKRVFVRDPECNPLEPHFKLRDDKGVLIDYGEIAGARPKIPYYRTNKDQMDRALKSRDILGNMPGTKGKGNFHQRERRDQVRPLTKNDDIVGSNPGSLVTGIKVPEGAKKRVTNPLNPNYEIPGRNEVPIDKINDPFGTKGCSALLVAKSSKQLPKLEKPPLSAASNGSGVRPMTAKVSTVPIKKVVSRRGSEVSKSMQGSL